MTFCSEYEGREHPKPTAKCGRLIGRELTDPTVFPGDAPYTAVDSGSVADPLNSAIERRAMISRRIKPSRLNRFHGCIRPQAVALELGRSALRLAIVLAGCFFAVNANAQTVSFSDMIAQTNGNPNGNLPAPYKAFASFSWYAKGSKPINGRSGPPAGFSSITSWGQVYLQKDVAPVDPKDCNIYVAEMQMYVHKVGGGWQKVQDQADWKFKLAGGHFNADFADNGAVPGMTLARQPDGSWKFPCPPTDAEGQAAYNDHFFPNHRGVWNGEIDGAFTLFKIKTDNPAAGLVATAGIDWWKDTKADWPNNDGGGGSNWLKVGTSYQYLYCTRMTPEQLRADPPPPFRAAIRNSRKGDARQGHDRAGAAPTGFGLEMTSAFVVQ